MCYIRRLLCLPPFPAREPDQPDRDQQQGRQTDQPVTEPTALDPGHVIVHDDTCQYIVENFVTRGGLLGIVELTHDAAIGLGQAVEHDRDPLGKVPGLLGQVAGLERDLGPRRRDEVRQGLLRDRPLGPGQPAQHFVEVLLNDPHGAAQVLERLELQEARATPALLVPDACHHDLEIGCLDASLRGIYFWTRFSRRQVELAAARCFQVDRAGFHPLQHGIHQGRLETDRVCGPLLLLVIGRNRFHDRLASLFAVERIDPQGVVKEAWDAALEAVELGHGVLANRDHQVNAEVRPLHELGKLLGEAALVEIMGVVEKVLLELVENQENRSAKLSGQRIEPHRRESFAGLSR